jgi:hypothetical protein
MSLFVMNVFVFLLEMFQLIIDGAFMDLGMTLFNFQLHEANLIHYLHYNLIGFVIASMINEKMFEYLHFTPILPSVSKFWRLCRASTCSKSIGKIHEGTLRL